MATDQALTPAQWTHDALQGLQRAAAASPFGALASPEEMCQGGLLYEYDHRGQRALVVLKIVPYLAGRLCEVLAVEAMPRSAPLQGGPLMQAIESEARYFHSAGLSLCTRHKAVALAAPRHGLAVTGAVIYKPLEALQ